MSLGAEKLSLQKFIYNMRYLQQVLDCAPYKKWIKIKAIEDGDGKKRTFDL